MKKDDFLALRFRGQNRAVRPELVQEITLADRQAVMLLPPAQSSVFGGSPLSIARTHLEPDVKHEYNPFL